MIAGLALAVALVAMSPAKLEEALESQRTLVAADPHDADLWNDLANLLVLTSRLDEAEVAYERALEIDPGLVSAHFNLGLLLQQKGRLGAAEDSYRTAVKLEPSHAWSHYQLGTVYEAQGKRGEAITAYANAFYLDQSLLRPEVNPHILDNRLVTQASLQAYARISAQPTAPRTYMAPGRIADLLVPPVAGEAAAEGAEPTEQRGEAGQSRILGRDSLEPGKRAGQATPQPNSPPTVGEDPRYRQSTSRGLPTGGVRQPGAAGTSRRFIPPTVVAPPTPSGEDDDSRSSSLSTGRLELRLRTAPQLQAGNEQRG